MARGGFLGRISRAIRNIVAPPTRRPEPPAPPPPPPPPPEPPRHIDWNRRIWRDNKEGRRGDYRKNKAVFDQMMRDIGETDPDALLELWQSYVVNIVNKGPKRRQDPQNMFWQDSGIDPADFNWARWREAMGYTGKRRSRTP